MNTTSSIKGLRSRVMSKKIIASSNKLRKDRRLIIKSYPNLKLFSFKDRSKLVSITS